MAPVMIGLENISFLAAGIIVVLIGCLTVLGIKILAKFVTRSNDNTHRQEFGFEEDDVWLKKNGEEFCEEKDLDPFTYLYKVDLLEFEATPLTANCSSVN